MRKRIVLAYDGGVKTSIAIPWLSEHHRAEVVTVTLDLGQRDDLEHVRERAIASGALRAHVLDVREEFAHDYLLRALQAGVLCHDSYPMGDALARPLIAKSLIDLARIESATAVAHGSTTELLFETLIRDLDTDVRIMTPVHDWRMTAEEALEYGRRRAIPLSAREAPDRVNLWGRSASATGSSSGVADSCTKVYTLTTSEGTALETSASIALGFEHGVPVSINGVPMSLTELIESLTLIAGQHGVGRFERKVQQTASTASNEYCEAPAAYVLAVAHADIGSSIWSRDLVMLRQQLRSPYVDLIRCGRWFTSLRESLDAFHASASSRVTGLSHVQVFKGQIRIAAPEMASYA